MNTNSSVTFGNITVTGNITLIGSSYVTSANVLLVNNPILYLAENNPSNIWDEGIVASYTSGTYKHTGMVRNHNDGYWTVFDNLVTEPTTTVNWSDASITPGYFKAGNISIVGNTASINASTGALLVTGGAGVSGNISVGGGWIHAPTSTVNIANVTATTVNFAGGATLVRIGGTTGNVIIGSSTDSVSSSTGAVILNGGMGIAKSLSVGGQAKLLRSEEVFSTYSGNITAGAAITLDCSTGQIFNVTSPSIAGNWTANLTNLSLDSAYASSITVIINQPASGSAYVINALQIGGSSQTINWQAGTIPSGNLGKKDVMTFSILNSGGTYTVLGQLVTFG